MRLLDQLIGRPLATHEEEENRVGVGAGIPMLGLDALSSCAYGPEAALTLLLPLGVAGLAYIGPITIVILVLLLILYLSYRQTIAAYPHGGGSYTVARENLGVWPGLLAAASLLLDYILNVAVGISAGVGALVSAFPTWQPHILAICLLILALITIVNLRGVKESGVAFALPTYLFIATLTITLAIGCWKVLSGNAVPVTPPPVMGPAVTGVTLWLLLRAFSNGCTAMTGVEAVSNGVSAFREPGVVNAQRTLTSIIALLAVLLAGIAWLCIRYHIGATDPDLPGYQSVISQLVGAIFGRGWFYYITMIGVLSVLALSANTSFAGFPRLCRLLAVDEYLPRPFANRGRRLVFSGGIVVLASVSALLLIVFGGITDRLIPLFAVGAFGAFTLSQAGMVVHWTKRQAWIPLAVNAVGAAGTLMALAVVLATKFVDGAWITVLLVPIMLWLFALTKGNYAEVEAEVECLSPIDLSEVESPPVVIIPVKGWSQITEKAIRFGLGISKTIYCLHVSTTEDEDTLRRAWDEKVSDPIREQGLSVPVLVVLHSPYRDIFRPLQEFVDEIKARHPLDGIAVIIPELVETRWWGNLLHNHRAMQLKAALLLWGDQRVSVINVPWFLRRESEKAHVHSVKAEIFFSES